MSKFFPLKVVQVTEETQDSKSVEFQIPQDLLHTFQYQSGQYLTLRFNINGEEVRRAYSLCSSPHNQGSLKVGVKRVKGGLVSNYINDRIKVGQTLDVLPPMGDFFVEANPENYKSYYLFAAGSGITPILSILRTVLETELNSHVYMVYGNKNQNTIMFDNEIKDLHKQYADRFHLKYTLSKPKSSWSGLFSSKNKAFRKGRIDPNYVRQFISDNPPYAQNTEYYVCGPEAMISNTKQALESIDIPENRIHIEYFGTGSTKTNEGVDNAILTAIINEESFDVTIPKSKTILRTLLDNKLDVPYSCEGGVCGMCKCKLTKGEVSMNNTMALDESEIEEGFILACQSVALTKTLEVHIND